MITQARTPDQIGNTIRRARKKLGLNQTDLGRMVGIGQNMVSMIENGNAGTRIDTILAILAVLDLELRIGPRTRTTAADIENIF